MRKNTPVQDPASLLAQLAMLVDLCPLGLMLSSERKIVHCNQRFADLFGYSQEELLGAGLAMLYPSPDEFDRIGERGQRSMADQGTYQDERLMRRRDGSLFWARVHGWAADIHHPFQLASWVFEPLQTGADISRLTPREREVLAGMARGLTAKESAKELGLSHRTVEKLRASMRTKFGTHNAAELISRISRLPQ